MRYADMFLFIASTFLTHKVLCLRKVSKVKCVLQLVKTYKKFKKKLAACSRLRSREPTRKKTKIYFEYNYNFDILMKSSLSIQGIQGTRYLYFKIHSNLFSRLSAKK